MGIPFSQCSSAVPGNIKRKTLAYMEKIYCLHKDLKEQQANYRKEGMGKEVSFTCEETFSCWQIPSNSKL